MTPYRVGSPEPEQADEAPDHQPELSMHVVLGLLFLVSSVRVIGALAGHEDFGAEATLALLVLLGCLAALAGHVARLRKTGR